MTTRYARLIKRGDVVQTQTPGIGSEGDVVRGVDMILHLSSGVDVVVSADSEVEVIVDTLPTDLVEQIEALQSESETTP